MDNQKSGIQQQFCLRWHNHQASLLSALPLLLDQAHLTDVTLSAEGKTLQAHRVVLSACSNFFSELFRTLDSSQHPVIVIPGSTFGTLVALLTFMYSGEVNVFEEQIHTLLTVAETLGIKGLEDFQNNLQNSSLLSNTEDISAKPKSKTYYPQIYGKKNKSALENFFIRSFQLCPNLLSEPLNFSQSALDKTTALLENYQQNSNFIQSMARNEDDVRITDSQNNSTIDIFDGVSDFNSKDVKKIEQMEQKQAHAAFTHSSPLSSNQLKVQEPLAYQQQPFVLKTNENLQQNFGKSLLNSTAEDINPFFRLGVSPKNKESHSICEKTMPNSQLKFPSTKVYATCFICHKQLSNQYNLRVHLETHQNVRYACRVCTHVSRSKDALRKHVSYRHPGICSSTESESRRKRSKILPLIFPTENISKSGSTTELPHDS